MAEATTPRVRSDPLPIPTGTRDLLERALERLPFEAHLSFEPLFRQIAEIAKATTNERCEQAAALVASLAGIPELRGAITDPEVVERHADAIRLLMSFVFPDLMDDEIVGRAYAPFAPGSFFTTQEYREVFGAEDAQISQANAQGQRRFYRENMLFAYFMLFHKHYSVEETHRAFVKQIRNKRTGLDRFFMNEGSWRFTDITHEGKEVLPRQEFQRLLDMEDLETLERRLPLDGVVYAGFIYVRFVEITELHNLSLLKTDLVEPNALNSPERFARIVGRLRSVLQVEDLEAGLVLRYKSMGDHRHCNMRSVLKDFDGCMEEMDDSVYAQVIESREPAFVADLKEIDCEAALVQHLQSVGYRSAGLIPLIQDDEVIGILELVSRQPDQIHTWSIRKINDLLAPLTIAARREMDEVVARIERTIKIHCTAIHPSVEWRFEEAAYRYNSELAEKGTAKFEDIVFENVHPLYGAMDIRGSSDSRNQAIQADLLEHLDLARSTLAAIYAVHPMPIADYFDTVLGRFRATVAAGLSSGDEISVIEFLHTRVEPFLDYVHEHVSLPKDPEDRDATERYYAQVDSEMRILYRQRKRYEEAVALINDTLVEFLEKEEEKAQAIFPHYFEKYKTDGVEHNIYVGQSMTAARTFDDVQLKNLRLWQLQLMCEKARIAESLVAKMRVPLRTTPLVLVQSSAMTIQFRSEEKRFEVEGSYNIRYEIIKKRIDKSTIRGTGERLTQPGKLAVIYTQDKEYDEYRRYLEYLADKGFLEPEIENLELDDLQGVNGLRALRAPIVLE